MHKIEFLITGKDLIFNSLYALAETLTVWLTVSICFTTQD